MFSMQNINKYNIIKQELQNCAYYESKRSDCEKGRLLMIQIYGNMDYDEKNLEDMEDKLALLGKKPSREIKVKNMKRKQNSDLDENWDVKYLYGESYNYGIYKKRLYRNGNKLCKRKSNKDALDDFLLDIYCKLWIFYHSEKRQEKSGSREEKLERKTPHDLYKMGLILSGRYSDWKKYTPYSVVNEAFEIVNKDYVVQGVGELLNNPTMCLLLLWDCVKIKNISKKDALWGVIEKVITSYHEDKENTGLSRDEKKLVIKTLIGKSDTNENISILESLQARNKITDKTEEKDRKAKMKELSQKYKPQLECLQEEIRKNAKVYDIDGNPNVNDGRFYFSSYLAPIVAAICENYEEAQNLLFVDNPIWTSKLSYEEIKGSYVETDMMKNYAILKRYSEFIELMDCVMETETEDNVLVKYETLCNLMIHKIMSDENPLSEKDRFVQYYAMEQLMHLQMIEDIVDILCENSHIVDVLCKNQEELKKEPYEIKMEKYIIQRILEYSNSYHSVFTKNKSVAIALKWLLNRFDKNAEEEKDENYSNLTYKAKSKIRRMDNRLWKKEKYMINMEKEEKIQSLMDSKEIYRDVLSGLEEYKRREELLREEEKNIYPREGIKKAVDCNGKE